MNERGCYCSLWSTNPTGLESRGVPRGYCGHCQTCGEPGHTRHFPGATPYTGSWCDKHYRRLSWLHPLASRGMFLYFLVFMAIIGSTFLFGD